MATTFESAVPSGDSDVKRSLPFSEPEREATDDDTKNVLDDDCCKGCATNGAGTPFGEGAADTVKSVEAEGIDETAGIDGASDEVSNSGGGT
jgi:hypothetical protein